jgi:Protein of unknown function (DUF4232)
MGPTVSTVKLIAVAAAAVAALAVAGPALAQQSHSAASVASPKAAPPCQSSGIDDWLDTSGGAAAGTTSYHLRFTNLSGHACTLQGFPFVFAVNLSGHQIGNRAVFNHVFPANPVTVGNGKTIHAVLGIADTGNFPAPACKPVTAAGLEVFAPTGINEVGRTVPFPFSACSTAGGRAPNFLSVTPAHPGA